MDHQMVHRQNQQHKKGLPLASSFVSFVGLLLLEGTGALSSSLFFCICWVSSNSTVGADLSFPAFGSFMARNTTLVADKWLELWWTLLFDNIEG